MSDQSVRRTLFVIWLLVLLAATVSLLFLPLQELVAIEFVILTFAVLYGFGVWPTGPTLVSLLAFATVAAMVMVPRAMAGDLPPVELLEVVAPVVLAAVVIYHVRRREDAVHRANRLADAERRRATARERLSRMTSHELRTPLTIATGYVDHLLAREVDEACREDLLTVRDELTQLARVSDRLVRAVALDLGAPDGRTDVCALLDDICRRWSGVVDRDLVVESSVPTVSVNADRLRAALDTLVENSVRYTDSGDRICLFSRLVDHHVEIGVADAGPGLSEDLILRITQDAEDPPDDDIDTPLGTIDTSVGSDAASQRLRDMYSRTGFGLRLVAGIARSAGGRVVASRSEYGGARVALVIPVQD